MQQNKYDDESFFGKYMEMPRSIAGLEAAGEWHALRSLIPALKGKNVLDLGCGMGWHCRYAREQQAARVVGVDLSAKMLSRAKELTNDPNIEYVQGSIEDITFEAGAFDVVISSLALHYVEHFDVICQRIYEWITHDGCLVLSMEHPIFTAREEQDWHYGAAEEILHWPVDNYQSEGRRNARFLGHDVVKYHRTLSTILNTIIQSGFKVEKIIEPEPSAEALAQYPQMRDESRRPMFLMLALTKA